MLELLARWRRRRLGNLIVEQAAVALSIAMGGAVGLLLLGTQILDWYWPVILFLGGMGAGLFRIRGRVPSPYRLLQAVDSRVHLHDTLSTAYYFGEMAASGRFSESARSAQREEAERTCRTIDARHAVPFAFPSSAYVAIAMIVVAGTLLAVRYGVHHSLDLRPPITEAVFEFFRPSPEVAELEQPAPPSPQYEPVGLPADQDGRREVPVDPEAEPTLSLEEVPGASGEGLNANTDRLREDGRAAEDGLENQAGDWDNESAGGDAGDSPPEAQDGESSSGDRPPSFPPQEESDLIRKMQDAFANLLSKLKIPPRAGDSRRTVDSSRSRLRAARTQQAEARGRKFPGAPQAEGMPSSDPQGDQNSDEGQQGQAGQGEQGEQASSRAGQQQSRSGAGSTDGSKDVELARQLEAMGKLSEIIGRRAENITGEVMVEVRSGDQRLRTAYSETNAAHRTAGGEIHRDEVPLALRHYVQRYFEEVRKEAPTPTPR